MPSIWCPSHGKRETFQPALGMQPVDNRLVRYPCGHVDGLSPDVAIQGDISTPSEIAELREEVAKLKERLRYVPGPQSGDAPKSTPGPPPSKGLAERYGSEI